MAIGALPVNPDIESLQGGSFDGTYSIDEVSPIPGANVTSFFFNLRKSNGDVVRRFSNLFTGNGAGFSFSSNKVSLGLGNTGGYLALDFAPSSSGIGPIQVNLPNKSGMSSKTVAGAGGGYRSTELDIVSGSIESVPTPALLPGLIGLGVATLRKQRGAVEAVTGV
jgi:hypothetical protein